MTVHLGRYFGWQLKTYRCGENDRELWIWGVIWYPRSRKMLGYYYPSFRIR